MGYLEEYLREEKIDSMDKSMSESSAVTGIVTPYTLMVTLITEIKELRKQNDEALRHNAEMMSLMKEQNSQMAEMLAVMKSQSDTMSAQLQTSAATLRATDRPVSLAIRQGTSSVPQTLSLKDRYVEGEKVSTGTGLITAILYQIINVVHTNYVRRYHSEITNENSVGFKEMRAVVDGVVKAAARAGSSISMPKPSEAAAKEALGYITSESATIPTQCNMEHIASLCSQCHSVMAITEKVREVLVKCEGVIGPIQQACLALVKYPYVENGSLSIDTEVMFKSIVNRMRMRNQAIRKMKAGQRNFYSELVLSGTQIHLALVQCTKDT